MTDPTDTGGYGQEPEPGAARAYAATHPVLCAHADQDGKGAHWLAPGEKCSAEQERGPSESGRGMLAPDAVDTYAAMLQAVEEPEAGQ
jgi:hypothetical protein